jgi:hypothetical protein
MINENCKLCGGVCLDHFCVACEYPGYKPIPGRDNEYMCDDCYEHNLKRGNIIEPQPEI